MLQKLESGKTKGKKGLKFENITKKEVFLKLPTLCQPLYKVFMHAYIHFLFSCFIVVNIMQSGYFFQTITANYFLKLKGKVGYVY